MRETHLYWLVGLVLVGCVVLGTAIQGPVSTLDGLLRIQVHPARLLNDFTIVGGEGGALVNAALVAALGLGLVRVVGVRLSGPTVAAVFTMLGFGLFGKTPLNALPIFAGVGIAAGIAGKSYKEYILMALYGTALGPLISALAVEAGVPAPASLAVAVVGGVAAGVILPPLGISMLRLHQGFNLYNIGLTCGFIGVFGAGILVASGHRLSPGGVWNTEPSTALLLLVPGISAVLAVAGLAVGPRRALRDLLGIWKLSGRLPSDFMTITSISGSLVNAGLIGLLMWGYVVVVGAPANGPVLGGMLTAVGFATFGKHPRNGWSVVVGVVLACLLFGKDLSAPGPVLAALFCLTLAPLAGEFGWIVGVVAGFLHLTMVERTGSWHLGVNLYNNGFAGGLTATLMVSLIEWFRSTRSRVLSPGRRGASREAAGEKE